MPNDALNVNPSNAAIALTTHGSNFLWAVFAIMLASGLGVLAWSKTLPVGQRAFHYISLAILFTASVAYFAMASNLGGTPVQVEFNRIRSDLYEGPVSPKPTRSIWYARYIDWTITTPLLLLDLLLATGLPLSQIFFVIFMDLLMIETGLIGALVASSYKWGFFAFGCAAQAYIIYVLLFSGRNSAKIIGEDAHRAYTKSAIILNVLWILYPIAWGVADGGNLITADSEMVYYGILDVLAKPGFVIFHLFSLRSIDYNRFGLQSGHLTDDSIAASKATTGTHAGPSHPTGTHTTGQDVA